MDGGLRWSCVAFAVHFSRVMPLVCVATNLAGLCRKRSMHNTQAAPGSCRFQLTISHFPIELSQRTLNHCGCQIHTSDTGLNPNGLTFVPRQCSSGIPTELELFNTWWVPSMSRACPSPSYLDSTPSSGKTSSELCSMILHWASNRIPPTYMWAF